jgi:hypothetical protein
MRVALTLLFALAIALPGRAQAGGGLQGPFVGNPGDPVPVAPDQRVHADGSALHADDVVQLNINCDVASAGIGPSPAFPDPVQQVWHIVRPSDPPGAFCGHSLLFQAPAPMPPPGLIVNEPFLQNNAAPAPLWLEPIIAVAALTAGQLHPAVFQVRVASPQPFIIAGTCEIFARSEEGPVTIRIPAPIQRAYDEERKALNTALELNRRVGIEQPENRPAISEDTVRAIEAIGAEISKSPDPRNQQRGASLVLVAMIYRAFLQGSCTPPSDPLLDQARSFDQALQREIDNERDARRRGELENLKRISDEACREIGRIEPRPATVEDQIKRQLEKETDPVKRAGLENFLKVMNEAAEALKKPFTEPPTTPPVDPFGNAVRKQYIEEIAQDDRILAEAADPSVRAQILARRDELVKEIRKIEQTAIQTRTIEGVAKPPDPELGPLIEFLAIHTRNFGFAIEMWLAVCACAVTRAKDAAAARDVEGFWAAYWQADADLTRLQALAEKVADPIARERLQQLIRQMADDVNAAHRSMIGPKTVATIPDRPAEETIVPPPMDPLTQGICIYDPSSLCESTYTPPQSCDDAQEAEGQARSRVIRTETDISRTAIAILDLQQEKRAADLEETRKKTALDSARADAEKAQPQPMTEEEMDRLFREWGGMDRPGLFPRWQNESADAGREAYLEVTREKGTMFTNEANRARDEARRKKKLELLQEMFPDRWKALQDQQERERQEAEKKRDDAQRAYDQARADREAIDREIEQKQLEEAALKERLERERAAAEQARKDAERLEKEKQAAEREAERLAREAEAREKSALQRVQRYQLIVEVLRNGPFTGPLAMFIKNMDPEKAEEFFKFLLAVMADPESREAFLELLRLLPGYMEACKNSGQSLEDIATSMPLRVALLLRRIVRIAGGSVLARLPIVDTLHALAQVALLFWQVFDPSTPTASMSVIVRNLLDTEFVTDERYKDLWGGAADKVERAQNIALAIQNFAKDLQNFGQKIRELLEDERVRKALEWAQEQPE